MPGRGARGALTAAPQFIHTLESQREFSARAKVYFASLLTVALHGKLEYYTDILRTLFLELMEQYVVAKNPKLMLRRCVARGGPGRALAQVTGAKSALAPGGPVVSVLMQLLLPQPQLGASEDGGWVA